MKARTTRTSWAFVTAVGPKELQDKMEERGQGLNLPKMTAEVSDDTGGPNTDTQRWNQPQTRCEVDPIDEAMQMTVQLVDSQGNGEILVN